MRKLALALVFLLTPFTAFATSSVSVSPPTGLSSDTPCAFTYDTVDLTDNLDIFNTDTGEPVARAWDENPSGDLCVSSGASSGNLTADTTGGGFVPLTTLPPGNYALISYSLPTYAATYTEAEETLEAQALFTVYDNPSSNGIGDLIAFSNSTFASTTGFTVAAGAAFAGDTFFNLFAGSGLAVLYELRWWIVALIMIAAVIYFGFRALRFFNH